MHMDALAGPNSVREQLTPSAAQAHLSKMSVSTSTVTSTSLSSSDRTAFVWAMHGRSSFLLTGNHSPVEAQDSKCWRCAFEQQHDGNETFHPLDK